MLNARAKGLPNWQRVKIGFVEKDKVFSQDV